MRFDEQLVVITGAASGIGRATAHAFAARGARLALCDKNQGGLEELRRALGDRVTLAEVVDVGDRAAMAAFAAQVHAVVPAADVIVNNAGVGQHGGILDTPLDDWDWVLRVNLMGVVHGCHFFTPPMAARGRGHVVNVSSMLGLYATPAAIAYVASKFAVLGMTLSIRGELAAKGVRATAICPGMIDTGIIDESRFGTLHRGLQAKLAETFHKRGASPSVVAAAIVDVVGHDVPIRPVTKEAWVAWGLTRFAPRALEDAFGRFAGKMQARMSRP